MKNTERTTFIRVVELRTKKMPPRYERWPFFLASEWSSIGFTPRSNITYTQAGISGFDGQESVELTVPFFTGKFSG
jgi:hypothetical protein